MSESNYNLYASRNLKLPDGVDFSLIPICSNGKYILLYTDKELGEGYVKIDESVKLEDEEKAWLAQAKIAVNTSFMQEHEEEYTEALNGFLDALSKELSAESKKAKEQPK